MHQIAAPLTWREIEQIPGLLPIHSLEINEGEDVAKPNTVEGKFVEIRWKRQVGLEWHGYKLIKIARVYGETHILIEKSDESRNWASLRDVSLIKLHAVELRQKTSCN